MDNIYWNILSGNYNAINMLKENIDRIDWYYFSNNQQTFSLIIFLIFLKSKCGSVLNI